MNSNRENSPPVELHRTDDHVKLSVSFVERKQQCSIEIPINTPEEQRKAFVELWRTHLESLMAYLKP